MGRILEKLMREVVVIIPCYNAGARVKTVAEKALEMVDRVLVINDGSTDGCIDGLRALPVRLIHLDVNRGKGHALIAGIRAALEYPDASAICLLDADGQHDPREIPGLFRVFQSENADLVIGARVFARGSVPWRSRFGNKVTAAVTAFLLRRRIPDTQCGFRMLSRRFAASVAANVAGGRYETEMEMIVHAVRKDFCLSAAPVATIYEPGNRSSHFRKISDSCRIYARLLRAAVRRA